MNVPDLQPVNYKTNNMPPKERKGNVNCCVVNCKNSFRNSPPETHFYVFPTAKYKAERREQWIIAVNRKNSDGSLWIPKQHSRICSDHFVGHEKSENQFSPSYNPTIFPAIYRKNTVDEKTAVERHQRCMARKRSSHHSYSNKKTTVTATLSQEPDLNLTNMTDVMQSFDQSKVDKNTQVNFLEKTNILDNSKVFICNRYIHSDTPGTCQAEIQTYLPINRNYLPVDVKKVKTVDRGCGSNITFTEQAVGPDSNDLNPEGLIKCKSGFHGVSSIKNDREMLDLAGVTKQTFALLLKICSKHKIHGSKISAENRLLIFLIRMKSGLTFSAIGVLFSIHRTTASRIFSSTLQYLVVACREFVTWPSKEIVLSTMPEVFKDAYEDCRVIIDCTEVRVEQPSTIVERVQLYSHYKKGFTIKFLVGCTPGGLISFLSRAYGGRTSDSQITNSCGLLDLIEVGDVILADKGFPGIKSTIDEKGQGVVLVMPPFLREGQFSEEDVNETYKIASVRIHIERIMQRIKTYNILSKFTVKMLPLSDDIIFMCCVLVNLQPPILKDP